MPVSKDAIITPTEAVLESNADDALVGRNLDHLLKTAVASGADLTTEVADGTILSNVLTTDGDTSGYARATHSLVALYNAIAGSVSAVNRHAGKMQMFTTTIDLHQAAATYDLATCTTQPVIIEAIIFRLPNIDVSDDAAITSISIQSDDATAQTYISSTQGAKANLDAEAQIAWVGASYRAAGEKVQLTIGGGTADADPTTCIVTFLYRAVVSGGYLA